MTLATITNSITQPSKPTESTDTKVLFKIAIQLIGIKKRCRKSERHFFQLGHVPYNDGNYNAEEITEKVKAFVDTNMKEVNSIVRVSLDHVVIKNEGSFTVTQWEPFSKLNKQFDLSL